MTICWTSGTTGRSKGVPRSHNHWLSSTLASEDAIKLKTGAVMLNPFPFINMAAMAFVFMVISSSCSVDYDMPAAFTKLTM